MQKQTTFFSLLFVLLIGWAANIRAEVGPSSSLPLAANCKPEISINRLNGAMCMKECGSINKICSVAVASSAQSVSFLLDLSAKPMDVLKVEYFFLFSDHSLSNFKVTKRDGTVHTAFIHFDGSAYHFEFPDIDFPGYPSPTRFDFLCDPITPECLICWPCLQRLTLNLCGNGTLDPGETCDDGNRISGDGCSSTCERECGHTVTCFAFCGNGIVEGSEECDNGSANSDAPGVSGATCRTNCTRARCGDHIRDAGEYCDGELGCPTNCRLRPPPPCVPPDNPDGDGDPSNNHGFGLCPDLLSPWTRVYGSGGGVDKLNLAVDTNGTVYMTDGSLSGERQVDACGTTVWEQHFISLGWDLLPHSRAPQSIDIDECGISYVATAGVGTAVTDQLHIEKVGFTGAWLGTTGFHESDNWMEDAITGIAVDKNPMHDAVYVVGTTGPATLDGWGSDIWLRKYNRALGLQWTVMLTPLSTDDTRNVPDRGASVAVGLSGDVYVAGTFGRMDAGSVYGYRWDAGIARYTPEGTRVWEHDWSTETDAPSDSRAINIAVDSGENVYINVASAGLDTASPPVDFFSVSKYNSSGALLGRLPIGGSLAPDRLGSVELHGLALDGSGNIYLSGMWLTGSDEFWMGKFDSAFSPVWNDFHPVLFPDSTYGDDNFVNVGVNPATGTPHFLGSIKIPPPGWGEPFLVPSTVLRKMTPEGGTDGWPPPSP